MKNKEVKFSKKQKQKIFLKEFAEVKNISKACKRVGISRATYYQWLKDEKFENKIEDVRESILDLAEEMLSKQLADSDAEHHWKALRMILQSKRASKRGYTEAGKEKGDRKEGGVTVVIHSSIPRPQIEGEVIDIESEEDKKKLIEYNKND